MKLAPAFLALALLAGCATPATQRSAVHLVIPAPHITQSLGWTATDEEIAKLEGKISALFNDPDKRVANLKDGFPPYAFNEYAVRYICTGPVESKFILVLAALKTSPTATALLDPTTSTDAPAPVGPDTFTVAYNLKEERVVELRFGR